MVIFIYDIRRCSHTYLNNRPHDMVQRVMGETEEVSAELAKILAKKEKGEKLTDAEKKKIKQANKSKANPGKSADKKVKQDAKRERRKESGSTKSFA